MRLLAACAVTATLLAGAPRTVAQSPPYPPPPYPPARDLGTLIVESDPPAEIVLDGEMTGLWTPQRMGLRPGHHAVTLVRRERRPSTYGFTIESGKTTRLVIHLAW
jgi:hypothetical protein